MTQEARRLLEEKQGKKIRFKVTENTYFFKAYRTSSMPPSFYTALILTFLLDLLKEFRYEGQRPLWSWHESSISVNRSVTSDKPGVGVSLTCWAALITKLTNKISLQKEVFFQGKKCLQNIGEWRLILPVLPSLCSSGPKVKRALAVTVPIWSQFPGTSRQECCCLSTINNNTVKIEGIQMDVTLALRLSASLRAQQDKRKKGRGFVPVSRPNDLDL